MSYTQAEGVSTGGRLAPPRAHLHGVGQVERDVLLELEVFVRGQLADGQCQQARGGPECEAITVCTVSTASRATAAAFLRVQKPCGVAHADEIKEHAACRLVV